MRTRGTLRGKGKNKTERPDSQKKNHLPNRRSVIKTSTDSSTNEGEGRQPGRKGKVKEYDLDERGENKGQVACGAVAGTRRFRDYHPTHKKEKWK